MLTLHQQNRTGIIFLALFVALAGLLGRLFDLQCLRFERYRERAQQQQKSVQRVAPVRGRILDCNGNVFAMSVLQPALCADPKMVKDAGAVAHTLEALTGIPADQLRALLSDPARRFVWITKDMDEARTAVARVMIKRGELPGVFIRELERRQYPKGALLGNVIGFWNGEGGAAEGLEFAARDLLEGRAGYRVAKRDNKRRQFFEEEWKSRQLEAQDGDDIYLTIDQYVQHIAEEELYSAVTQYSPHKAVALIMQPRTGQMLAMAMWPAFDPDSRTNFVPGELQNYAASQIFEPGSTMKAIVGAAALNEGVVELDSRFYCENGRWQVTASHALRDDHPLGEASFREIIQHSSNIGMAKVAQGLGRQVLYTYLRQFGLGRETGMPLVSAESAGILRPPAQWSQLSMFTIPIGHEVGVTCLQLLAAVATIANKGMRLKPSLVKRVVSAGGQLPPEATRFNYFDPVIVVSNVISREAADRITEAMLCVTDKEGTGHLADIPGYSVAGKTGTAQKFIAGAYRREYVASFVGFVPASNPELCALVVVDAPKGGYYGGEVAAPVFRRMCERTLAYLKVPQDRVEPAAVAAPVKSAAPQRAAL